MLSSGATIKHMTSYRKTDMSQRFKRWALFVLAGGAVLALDQAAKWWVTSNLEMGESWVPVPALMDFIVVTRSFNTGAAFGIFPQASSVYMVLALVTVVAFLFLYPRLPDRAWLSRLSVALIAGGALSNAIDRLRFDHVVDYVHVRLTPNFANVSNFADHAITVGVILLLIDQWLMEREALPEHADADTFGEAPTSLEAGDDAERRAPPTSSARIDESA